MTLKDYLIQAVAGATVIAAGASLVGDKVELARHDERIQRIEKLDESIDGLRKDLTDTREQLARIDTKLETQDARK